MPPREQIRLLMLKAAQDEYVLDALLNDPRAPVEVFGFHAQQAAEKMLKAIIVAAGGTFPMSHRIAELLDLAKDLRARLPDSFEELRHLTPFAVEFRYDVMPEESEEPLDVRRVRQLLRDLRAWAEKSASGVST
ncbi:MAG: HEPN domain-containing protein [Deltaproteobacteria bacterium]|nr:HEPN domain-containing protein [Deltaproteobacteria bacterium]